MMDQTNPYLEEARTESRLSEALRKGPGMQMRPIPDSKSRSR